MWRVHTTNSRGGNNSEAVRITYSSDQAKAWDSVSLTQGGTAKQESPQLPNSRSRTKGSGVHIRGQRGQAKSMVDGIPNLRGHTKAWESDPQLKWPCPKCWSSHTELKVRAKFVGVHIPNSTCDAQKCGSVHTQFKVPNSSGPPNTVPVLIVCVPPCVGDRTTMLFMWPLVLHIRTATVSMGGGGRPGLVLVCNTP